MLSLWAVLMRALGMSWAGEHRVDVGQTGMWVGRRRAGRRALIGQAGVKRSGG